MNEREARHMKAAVWYDQKDVRIEERAVKDVKDYDVKIKVAWSGICGTDLHEYEIGGFYSQKKETPNAYTGETTPIVLGHEFSGIVEEVGNLMPILDLLLLQFFSQPQLQYRLYKHRYRQLPYLQQLT